MEAKITFKPKQKEKEHIEITEHKEQRQHKEIMGTKAEKAHGTHRT